MRQSPGRLPDEDATILIRRPAAPSAPPSPRAPRWRVAVPIAVIAALAAGGASWFLSPHRVPAPRVLTPAAPAFPIQTADEQQILNHVATHLTVFRFAANPHIIVLDFPSLLEQGEMLDRVAALIEKAGLPRNRVLTDAQLTAAIHATGDTVSTWYYGHDYPAAAIARFFALADAEHIALNRQEQRLRALARQLGWFAPRAVGAVITIPRVGSNANVTLAARAAILHHELSHGQFFTDPAYAAYVRDFWRLALTQQERDNMRRFLGSEGYDTSDDALMYNEAQAYLFFTPDPAFFAPKDAGLTDARRLALKVEFLKGMPRGWLRQSLARSISPVASRR